MRGVLLDTADGLLQPDEHLRSRGVRDRCELVAQSFFDPVEITADVWLYSQVLHDWSDAECRTILNRVWCMQEQPGSVLLRRFQKRFEIASIGRSSGLTFRTVVHAHK